MDDRQKLEVFGEMVTVVDKLSAPWRHAFYVALASLISVALIMGGIIFYLVHCAYTDPVDVSQEQSFSEQSQTQSYSSGITDGD